MEEPKMEAYHLYVEVVDEQQQECLHKWVHVDRRCHGQEEAARTILDSDFAIEWYPLLQFFKSRRSK